MVYFTIQKLKFGIKNGTEITLNLSSNLVGNSNDETIFPYKLWLTDTQVSKICKAFANGSLANMKFQKLNCIRWYSQEKLWLVYLV